MTAVIERKTKAASVQRDAFLTPHPFHSGIFTPFGEMLLLLGDAVDRSTAQPIVKRAKENQACTRSIRLEEEKKVCSCFSYDAGN